MLRPGWFPEYSPQEQEKFDMITDSLRQHFERWNYHHIYTPAVESLDILSRGGDVFDKQVYWLYGLAQWVEDVKDFGLHFDLTIPFARYVLDHLNDLTFPFKRYQMQPVWRGERTKRGRYKEFWQFDIDSIRRSDQNVGMWYDAESIIVIYQALQSIFTLFGITNRLSVKISNIALINHIAQFWWLNEWDQKQLFKILDDRYKRSDEDNNKLLSALLTAEQHTMLVRHITSQSLDGLEEYEWYQDLLQVIQDCQQFGINVEFALPIVRWHWYYTGTVVEIFVDEDMSLWAIAGGWRYEKLTDFISSKQSFSGVGCSISSRIMELILDQKAQLLSIKESYMIINFEETRSESLKLLTQLHEEWKSVEFYPVPIKLSKQFDYANKQGITHCVMLGKGELEHNNYMIKDLATWEQTTYSLLSK